MASPPDPITILILVAANGFTADIIACASLTRDPDLWSYLVKEKLGEHRLSWLHAAAALNHADRVHFLCDVGLPLNARYVDVNTSTYYLTTENLSFNRGNTALHLTCKHGCAAAAAALLSRGADVDARNDSGVAPLFEASYGGWAPVVRLLPDKGANVKLVLPGFREVPTPLHAVVDRLDFKSLAAERDHASVIGLLLQSGADVNSRESLFSYSALEVAIRAGKADLVQAILQHSARCGASKIDTDGCLSHVVNIANEANAVAVCTVLFNSGITRVASTTRRGMFSLSILQHRPVWHALIKFLESRIAYERECDDRLAAGT